MAYEQGKQIMQKIKKALKIIGFLCLLLLALVGIGIPIPMFIRDRFEAKKELLKEEQNDKEEDYELT